jgi:WD40 repeat protein
VRRAEGDTDQTWPLHHRVQPVCISPDGTQLATGSYDQAARLWDVASSGELARMEHGNPVLAVAFSPDGTQLSTGSSYKTARLSIMNMGPP